MKIYRISPVPLTRWHTKIMGLLAKKINIVLMGRSRNLLGTLSKPIQTTSSTVFILTIFSSVSQKWMFM
jgi:hypothetical protein